MSAAGWRAPVSRSLPDHSHAGPLGIRQTYASVLQAPRTRGLLVDLLNKPCASALLAFCQFGPMMGRVQHNGSSPSACWRCATLRRGFATRHIRWSGSGPIERAPRQPGRPRAGRLGRDRHGSRQRRLHPGGSRLPACSGRAGQGRVSYCGEYCDEIDREIELNAAKYERGRAAAAAGVREDLTSSSRRRLPCCCATSTTMSPPSPNARISQGGTTASSSKSRAASSGQWSRTTSRTSGRCGRAARARSDAWPLDPAALPSILLPFLTYAYLGRCRCHRRRYRDHAARPSRRVGLDRVVNRPAHQRVAGERSIRRSRAWSTTGPLDRVWVTRLGRGACTGRSAGPARRSGQDRGSRQPRISHGASLPPPILARRP